MSKHTNYTIDPKTSSGLKNIANYSTMWLYFNNIHTRSHEKAYTVGFLSKTQAIKILKHDKKCEIFSGHFFGYSARSLNDVWNSSTLGEIALIGFMFSTVKSISYKAFNM